MELREQITRILESQKLAYLATSDGRRVDNAVICFSYDDQLNLYFGSFSDTMKCRNMKANPLVAVCISTLQIHGTTREIEHGSEEYHTLIAGYNRRFPEYAHVFDKERNELYQIRPLVVWNYRPAGGEMHRDTLILDNAYYQELNPYIPPREFRYRSKA